MSRSFRNGGLRDPWTIAGGPTISAAVIAGSAATAMARIADPGYNNRSLFTDHHSFTTAESGEGAGWGLGVTLGVGVGVGVAVGVPVGVDVGVAVAVGVGVGGGPDCAQYLPPVLKDPK